MIDQVIAQERPVLGATHTKPLPDLEQGQTRYVLGRDGLYLESRPCWGWCCVQLWEATRPTPYAPVRTGVSLNRGPIPREMLQRIRSDAIRRLPDEYAGFVLLDSEGYRYVECDSPDRSPGHIRYERPADVVLDVHSHACGNAYFSATDMADMAGGVFLAMVLGHVGEPTMHAVCALAVEGHIQKIELAEFAGGAS